MVLTSAVHLHARSDHPNRVGFGVLRPHRKVIVDESTDGMAAAAHEKRTKTRCA